MSPQWDDLNARARGLGAHFLTRAQLEALAREPDMPALAAALRRHGVLTGALTEVPRPEELELAIRRWAAAALLILARWAGPRSAALPLVFDDEDRRSLRAIFRGAVQRAPAERRLAGLIPTPTLPERALEALAGTPTAAAASALLAAWRHPFATAVAPASAAAQPDLFALESALSQALAVRATQAAARAHSRTLRAAVRDAIDLDNARTAVMLSMIRRDVVARDQFLPGGARVSIILFGEAVATGEPRVASARLAIAFRGTPYADLFAARLADRDMFDDELLRRRLRDMALQARRDPVGPLPLLWFALRLRAQLLDLQRIIWTVALGAPRQPLAEMLATAAT